MGLLKPVERVFGKSGLWSDPLCIYEFTHTGPSRSGQATVSVVTLPNGSIPVIIVYAHHEDTESYTLEEWNALNEEYDNKDSNEYSDLLDITKIINDILTKESV